MDFSEPIMVLFAVVCLWIAIQLSGGGGGGLHDRAPVPGNR